MVACVNLESAVSGRELNPAAGVGGEVLPLGRLPN